MKESAEATREDPRPVPPLGYCAQCVRNGIWTRAASSWEGTTYCAQCLIAATGAGEEAHRVARETGDEANVELTVLETLHHDMQAGPTERGF